MESEIFLRENKRVFRCTTVPSKSWTTKEAQTIARNDFCQFGIGLAVPDTNVVAEREFHAMAPEGVAVYTTRVLHKDQKPSDTLQQAVRRLVADLPDAVARIAAAGPDIIVFGCTGGSFIGGPSWNQGIIETIQRIGEVPGVTVIGAIEEALNHMSLRRIAVGSLFPDEMAEKLREYLEEMGIIAKRMASVPYQEAQWEETAYRLAKDLDGPDIDGILLAGTDFRAVHALAKLERELRKPVISSNQASLWACLRSADVPSMVNGFGSLFQAK